MSSVRCWVVLLCLGALLAGVARADIFPSDPPEGRRVPGVIELDWGPFAERVTRLHVVKPGETLRTIATRELGDVRHLARILESNPALRARPDHIEVGAAVWLPPLRALAPAAVAADGLLPWYDAFWLAATGYRESGAVARASPGEVPARFVEGGTLALVPHAHASKLIAGLSQGPVVLSTNPIGGQHRTALKVESLAQATVYPNTLVHRDDPTQRVVGRVTLRGIEGLTLLQDLALLRLDAAGVLISTPTLAVRQPALFFPEQLQSEPWAGLRSAAGPAVPLAAQSTAQPDARWPASTGLCVALAGALLVAAVWFARRRALT